MVIINYLLSHRVCLIIKFTDVGMLCCLKGYYMSACFLEQEVYLHSNPFLLI